MAKFRGFTAGAVIGGAAKRSTEILEDTRKRTARLVDTQTSQILNDASNAKKLLDNDIVKARDVLNQGRMLGIEDRDTLRGWLALDEDSRKEYQKSINTSRSLARIDGVDKQQDFYSIMRLTKPAISPAPGSNIFDINETWIEKTSKEYAGLMGGKTGANEREQLSFKEEFAKNLRRNYGLGDIYSQAEERAIQLGGYGNKEYLDQLLYKSKRTPFAAPEGVAFQAPIDIAKSLQVRAAQYAAEQAEFSSKSLSEIDVFKNQVNEQGNIFMPGLGFVPATTKHFELVAYWDHLKKIGEYYKDTLGKPLTSGAIRAYMNKTLQQSHRLLDVDFDTDPVSGTVLSDSNEPVTRVNDATNIGLNSSAVHTVFANRLSDENAASRIAYASMQDMAIHSYLKSAYAEHLSSLSQPKDTVEEFNKFVANLTPQTQYGNANTPNRLTAYARGWANTNNSVSSRLALGQDQEGSMVIPQFNLTDGSKQLLTNKAIADMWINLAPKAAKGAEASNVLFPQNTPTPNEIANDEKQQVEQQQDMITTLKRQQAAALQKLGPNPSSSQIQDSNNSVLAQVLKDYGITFIASPDTVEPEQVNLADAIIDATPPPDDIGVVGTQPTTTQPPAPAPDPAPAPTTQPPTTQPPVPQPAAVNLTNIFSINAISKNYNLNAAAQQKIIKDYGPTNIKELQDLYKRIYMNLEPEVQKKLVTPRIFNSRALKFVKANELPLTNFQDLSLIHI